MLSSKIKRPIALSIVVQVAFVSGNTYTFVQFFAAGLFLYSDSSAAIGYYPSSGMVRPCVSTCMHMEQLFSITTSKDV